MGNEEHIKILRQGVDAWNQWRQEKREITPDLFGADIERINLAGANLTGANFSGANLTDVCLRKAQLFGSAFCKTIFRRANLLGANLWEANLSGADLHHANLAYTRLYRADLYQTNLKSAHLTCSDFNQTNLIETNCRGSVMGGTVFADCDLSVATGLESVIHEGPSTIGLDTIYVSQGRIPEVFLRGVGLPENFITYVKSLVGQPIQSYSCFVSYSSKDQEFADRLYADLQSEGVRCWFAPEDIEGGKKLHEQIDEAIRNYERLLLVLSPHSMTSEWVKTEIAKARKKEIQQKRLSCSPFG
jgi:TIR domain/Pentapeptide repeats (8 copies)